MNRYWNYLKYIKRALFYKIGELFNDKRGVIFYAHYPSFYLMMFKETHKYIPDVEVVTFNDTHHKLLVEYNINVVRNKYPKVLVEADFDDGTFPSSSITRINVTHGLVGKNYTFNRKSNSRYDYIIVPGPYHFSKYLENGIPAEKLVKIGFPKLDPLLNNDVDATEIKRSLGIKNSNKIILYTPTTRDEFNSLPRFHQAIANIDLKKYNVVVKLHPGYNPRINEQGRFWVDYFKSIDGLYLAPFEETTPYLYISDLLIGDYGSTPFEFCLLDRPIIFLNNPNISNVVGGFEIGGVEDVYRNIGINILEPNDLNQAIDNSFEKDSFSEMRKKCKSELFYEPDGKAAQRLAGFIKQVYNEATTSRPS